MRWLIGLLAAQARRLPQLGWRTRVILGLVVAVMGLLVLTRPLESLALLIALVALSLLLEGLHRLSSADRSTVGVVVGVGLVAAAVLLVAWPRLTVDALAVIVGVSLVAHGVHELATATRAAGTTWRSVDRIGRLAGGSAWAVFGTLALVWPDVSLLVVGVAFGLRLVGFGASEVLRAWRDRTRSADGRSAGQDGASDRRPLGALGVAGRGTALLCALALLAVTLVLHQETPRPGAAYRAADSAVPGEPGRLVKSTPYSHGVPDGARGWLILYTTTDAHGDPTTATAFVMAPDTPPPGPGDVVLWDHGTEGADISCAPTLLPEPSPLAAPVAALREQLERGRVLVGPNYPGMGTPGAQSYLVGEVEGRAGLDAVLAAREIDGLDLSPRTVVWGHSQGGHAALWTGALAATHTSEIDLVGVAAAAPATEVRALIPALVDDVFGKIMGSFLLRAYAETYDDVSVDAYVDPRMRLVYDAVSRRCLPMRTTLVSLVTALAARGPMFRTDPSTGPLGDRLDQNVPRGPIGVPVLIGQGGDDPLILPQMQARYVRERCRAGQALDYRTYAGRDHLSVVADDSPFVTDLLAWTEARFAGEPARSTC
ncbi:lipase family protein [Nocardioides sp. R1-1]|uniref:lipase family protein n=1 Tax=Nocardioides sp. R1-1 TaxID=3383502 RepID=UPI0038CFC49C